MNERTYFDRSGTPRVLGNGFEDDHNMGWGLQNLAHAVFGAHDVYAGFANGAHQNLRRRL